MPELSHGAKERRIPQPICENRAVEADKSIFVPQMFRSSLQKLFLLVLPSSGHPARRQGQADLSKFSESGQCEEEGDIGPGDIVPPAAGVLRR